MIVLNPIDLGMGVPLHAYRTDPWSRTLATNLRYLLALRWFVIAGCLALLAASLAGVELVVATPVAWGSLILYGAANASVSLLLRRRAQIGERFFLANLALDLLLLFVFLHQSGGSANPFTLLFLLPVIVAAATLKPVSIWVVTALSIAAYTLLLWRSPEAHHHHSVNPEFELHLVGMWLGLMLIAGLVAYFVTWMGRALRDRERALAEARERALRDERVIALGALAAGAAHELGTPLSTMAVLLKEMEQEEMALDSSRRSQVLQKRIDLLRAQVDRCKSALSGLSVHGQEIRAEAGRGLTSLVFLQTMVEQLRASRPYLNVQLTWEGPEPDRTILADQTLRQALGNFLNNAADASPETLTVTGWQSETWLTIEIEDRGGGMNERVARDFGQKPVSTKLDDGGMGIGMMLAHSIIERLGGRVEVVSTGVRGTCIRIYIPLAKLLLEPAGDPPQKPSENPR